MINDLTNDPITYAINRIELINHTQKNIVPKLEDTAETFEEYRLALSIFMREYSRQLEVISRHIGGVYVERYNPQNKTNKDPYSPAPSDEQRRAMQSLNKYAFSTEAFLLIQICLRELRFKEGCLIYMGNMKTHKFIR